MRRVPALDGLRALAVIGVFLYHTEQSWASGGWLGVDAFFVLSGYLITELLLRERAQAGRIDVISFWLRRAARLYPALLLTVLAVVVSGAVAGHVDWLASVVSVTYTSNLWMVTGHALGPLGHTWSLAAEEQFYLLWPLCLWFATTSRRVGMLAGATAGLSLCLLLVLGRPFGSIEHGVFVFPLTRAWELLAGCGLAAALHRRDLNHRVGLGAAILSITAGCGALVSATIFPPPNPRLTVSALLAVVATAAFLTAIRSGSRLGAPLSARPMRSLGRISYGVYLYHLPMLSVKLFHSPWLDFALAAILTLAAAWISFKFIELPIQHWAAREIKVHRAHRVSTSRDRITAEHHPGDAPTASPIAAPGIASLRPQTVARAEGK